MCIPEIFRKQGKNWNAAWNGYYREPKEEELQGKWQSGEEAKNGIRSEWLGMPSDGNHKSLPLQLVKHLAAKGYKACYVEVNATGFCGTA